MLELADSDSWVVASAFAEEVQLQDAGLRMKFSEQICWARASAASKPKKASTGRASKALAAASSAAAPAVAGDGSVSGSSGARKGKRQPSRGEVVGVVLLVEHPLSPVATEGFTPPPITKWSGSNPGLESVVGCIHQRLDVWVAFGAPALVLSWIQDRAVIQPQPGQLPR
ncbi:hypothetical protein QOT17_009951 [Balamuthia mandrillaris]